jgi:hypothetical protein
MLTSWCRRTSPIDSDCFAPQTEWAPNRAIAPVLVPHQAMACRPLAVSPAPNRVPALVPANCQPPGCSSAPEGSDSIAETWSQVCVQTEEQRHAAHSNEGTDHRQEPGMWRVAPQPDYAQAQGRLAA